ncbi:hypothetical protein GGI17_006430 [Coemansia sp. S146]|nr:hypothetical protein GGI17_006430 [Coemansia sp. S146]
MTELRIMSQTMDAMNRRLEQLESNNQQLQQQLAAAKDKKPQLEVAASVPNPETGKIPSNVKLPIFGGRLDEDVQTWLAQICMIYDAAELDVKQRFLHTVPLLQGVAACWVVSLLKSRRVLWSEFMEEIVDRFTRQHANLVVRDKLYSLNQQGSVVIYGGKFQTLISRLSDMSEIEKISLYQRGLYPSLRAQVRGMAEATLDDNMKIAKAFDRQSTRPAMTGHQAKPRMETAILSTSDREQYLREGHCFNCGIAGHLSRNCTKAKKATHMMDSGANEAHSPGNESGPGQGAI